MKHLFEIKASATVNTALSEHFCFFNRCGNIKEEVIVNVDILSLLQSDNNKNNCKDINNK